MTEVHAGNDLICKKIDDVLRLCEEMDDKLDTHGERLAALDERTKQHEKRMDRMSQDARNKGGVAGTVAGSVASGVVAVILNFLGFGRGS